MKKTLILAILSLLLPFASRADEARKDTLRLLTIGNSFSVDAVNDYLHEIAATDGVTMIIGDLYIGGCKLQRHWANAQSGDKAYTYFKQNADGSRDKRPETTLLEGILDEPWDFITMQQGGGLYGKLDTYYPEIKLLKDYVTKHATNPDVKLGIHQIWSVPANAVGSCYVQRLYDGNQGQMYRENVSAARTVQQKEKFDFLVPTGTAIENMRHTFIGNNIYRDAHHLSYFIGRYTAALTWYETLTGNSVIGNSFEPEYVLPERRELAQKSAHAAVACPDKVTQIGYDTPKRVTLEKDVPSYTLPDPLLTDNGKKVRTVRKWEKVRRPEILKTFEDEMFGRSPLPTPEKQHYEVMYVDSSALGGLATRKEVNIFFNEGKDAYLTMLLYIPNAVEGPVPAFLGVNFKGNWGVCKEEGIYQPPFRANKKHNIIENQRRGDAASRWPLEMILKAGYAVATYYRGDTSPDIDNGHNNALHRSYYRKGQKHPEKDEWGTIGAWAWGLSRCLDYLETDNAVNAEKVAVFGHSRLGKTSLWAGATDPRFALVISNCSGCGGAAISRRHFGETVQAINRTFNHWFCDNFKKYNENEASLPIDQHELLALIAPRPLYVVSATGDGWADPHGEFISACEASRVYNLYGLPGLIGTDGKPVTKSLNICLSDPTVQAISGVDVDVEAIEAAMADVKKNGTKAQRKIEALKYAPMPAPDQPLLDGTVGYHIHTGKHDINAFDWSQYIKFADRFLK